MPRQFCEVSFLWNLDQDVLYLIGRKGRGCLDIAGKLMQRLCWQCWVSFELLSRNAMMMAASISANHGASMLTRLMRRALGAACHGFCWSLSFGIRKNMSKCLVQRLSWAMRSIRNWHAWTSSGILALGGEKYLHKRQLYLPPGSRVQSTRSFNFLFQFGEFGVFGWRAAALTDQVRVCSIYAFALLHLSIILQVSSDIHSLLPLLDFSESSALLLD